jgi:hypothetical protein
MPEGLFHSLLKATLVRQLPEGMCQRCVGTGFGEEVADMGEALWHGADFPIRECNSCSGTGMAAAKTHITALGWMLLLAIAGATWACPPRLRLILILSTASIMVLKAAFRRWQTVEEGVESSAGRQTSSPIAPLPGAPGPETEGVLSLNAAIESHRQTGDQVESQPTRASL